MLFGSRNELEAILSTNILFREVQKKYETWGEFRETSHY
jgi:hypothetical protein